MDNLIISIIIPVYNTEQYLEQCLNSLLKQGLPKDQYEIICVNDGSGDDSSSIIREYANQYPNIIAIDKENEGVSAARNKGLKIARGKYVWFVDADDWIAENFLEKSGIINLLCNDSMDVPLILTTCIDVHNNEADHYSNYQVSIGELTFEEVKPFMTTARGHFFNRNLIESNHLRFDPNLAYGEDLMFMREFLDIIRFENEKNRNYRILQCNGKGVYLYRIHDMSAMGGYIITLKKWLTVSYTGPDCP